MAEKMNPNLAAAYGKAKKIRDIEKGNPRIANMSPKERVNKLVVKNDERGAPEPVNQQTKEQNNRAVSDFLEKKGIFRTMEVKPKARPKPDVLPKDDGSVRVKGMEGGNPTEYGGPKEDLEEVAGQLGKASKLHGNQSKRVAKIAKGMKGEVGNPYMKRSKSKYGM
tara:strand:- start:357 stop:854 length:498 start_codon:yes stop_codon:yes gene_type:complete